MKRNKKFLVVTCALLILAVAAVFAASGCGKKVEPAPTAPSTRPSGTPPATTTGPSGAAQKVLLVVANKEFENTEYTAVRTALVNAGYVVVVANSSGLDSTDSQGNSVKPDITIPQAKAADYVAIVLIGGSGVVEYYDDTDLHWLVRDAEGLGEVVAAICIAPVVLANAGLLQGKKGTVWPDEKGMLAEKGCKVQDGPVVVEGKIITATGPEAADSFAEEIVRALKGP